MEHHHINHRRILASPQEPLNQPSSSMDPTLKKQPKHNSTHPPTKNPDPIIPAKPFYYLYSTPNPNQKSSKTAQKPSKSQPPPCIDTRLQAKAMTLSADFDASKFALLKPKHHQQHITVEPKLEKEKTKKSSSKELDKKKIRELTVHEKRKNKEIRDRVKDDDSKEGKGPIDVKGMPILFASGSRRRSFCGSQVELADFLASCGAKVVSVDMPPFMQIHAVDCARKTCDSLEKFTSKTLALTLKKEFDGVYGPAWHCIAGTSFGSFVTHSVGGFLYFSIDQKMYILLFKTTVQRAD